MKFILAAILFFIFVWIFDTAMNKIRVEHKNELENDPSMMKRLKRFSRIIGGLGILSYVLLFSSVIYFILS